jgi:hypothetical protein
VTRKLSKPWLTLLWGRLSRPGVTKGRVGVLFFISFGRFISVAFVHSRNLQKIKIEVLVTTLLRRNGECAFKGKGAECG